VSLLGNVDRLSDAGDLTARVAALKRNVAAAQRRTVPAPIAAPRGGAPVSLLSTITKAVGAVTGGPGKGAKSGGTLGSLTQLATTGLEVFSAVKGLKQSSPSSGGLFPSIPGDIGDFIDLPSLGGGGGGNGPGVPAAFPFLAPTAATKKAKVAAVNAGMACPPGYHPAKDGSGRCVRNRRMNVCNMRAARRAIRRIKGARKELQKIERMLPRRPAARSRSRVPGHRERLTHT